MSKRSQSAATNPVAVTMRRRSTLQMDMIGGGFLGELSEEQEEALRLCRNGVQHLDYPEREGAGTFRLDDRMLLRFLRAQAFNTLKAINMIKDHLQFRERWRPHEIQATDPDVQAFIDKKIWEIIAETDDGHPVEVLRFRNYHPSEFSVEAFTRAIVYHRERVLEKLINPLKSTSTQNEEFVLRERSMIIFDAQGWRVGDQGTPTGMRQMAILFDVLTKQYVETLGVGAIVYAPAVFRWSWAMIRPFMDQETANRVVFVQNMDEIIELVNPNKLPTRYGGTIEELEMPIQPAARTFGDVRKSLALSKKKKSTASSDGIHAAEEDQGILQRGVEGVRKSLYRKKKSGEA